MLFYYSVMSLNIPFTIIYGIVQCITNVMMLCSFSVLLCSTHPLPLSMV